MANRSRKKFDMLKVVTEDSRVLLAKEEQIQEKVWLNIDLRNELDQIKAERTRQVYLLKKEIENLTKGNLDLDVKAKSVTKAHRDDVERLEKRLTRYDQQLVQNLQQIKALSEEKSVIAKRIEDLEQAAKTVVDMVDTVEDGATEGKSFLERQQGAPQKITNYISGATKTYVAHVLGLFKSFWPSADLDWISTGMAADCTQEKFDKYLSNRAGSSEDYRESRAGVVCMLAAQNMVLDV